MNLPISKAKRLVHDARGAAYEPMRYYEDCDLANLFVSEKNSLLLHLKFFRCVYIYQYIHTGDMVFAREVAP